MGRRVGYSPAITSEQTWGDWYNQNRLLLNPFVTGAVVGLAGVANALAFPMWPHTVAWVAIATLALIVWTVTLHDSGQRAFYRLMIAVGAAWMFLLQTSWAAEHWRAFAIGWFVATMVSGIGYWTDQRVKTKIKIRREIDAWPMVARKIGIPLAHITQKVTTDSGYRRRLSWDAGDYTRSFVFGLKEKIEAALNIPSGQLRMMPVTDGDDNTNSNAWDLVVNTESAMRKAPLAFNTPTMRSITDLMYVGNYEDGEQVNIHWYEQGFGGVHTLAAGMTRSGKSGLYRLMLGETAPCDDVVRLGIDAKGGIALRPWGPLFHWLVCGRNGAAVEEQAAMLEWLDAVMMYRENYAADKKWDVWKVSRKHPLIILYVDEAAEVFGLKLENFHATQLVEKIGRMGAGVGVLLCAATQYPTVDAIASSQIQSQIGRRFCFRVQNIQNQHVILPKATGIDATFPDKPIGSKGAGWCFLSDQGAMREMPLRVRNLKPEQVFELVESYAHVQCPLDAGSASVPVRQAEYQARRRWTIEDVRPDRPGNDVWDDELDEMGARDDEDPVTGGVPVNVPTQVTESVTDRVPNGVPGMVTEAKEQVVNGTQTEEIPAGVAVSLEELLTPRTPEDAAKLAAAVAQWNAEQTEWSTEMATAAFWATLRQFSGTPTHRGPGVKVATLAEACHRSPSWVHEQMHKARMGGLIQPVKSGSPYNRLVDGAKIPEPAHAG
jgi:hypothetical protein